MGTEDVKRETIPDVLCSHVTLVIILHPPCPCQFWGSSRVPCSDAVSHAQTRAMAGAAVSQFGCGCSAEMGQGRLLAESRRQLPLPAPSSPLASPLLSPCQPSPHRPATASRLLPCTGQALSSALSSQGKLPLREFCLTDECGLKHPVGLWALYIPGLSVPAFCWLKAPSRSVLWDIIATGWQLDSLCLTKKFLCHFRPGFLLTRGETHSSGEFYGTGMP